MNDTNPFSTPAGRRRNRYRKALEDHLEKHRQGLITVNDVRAMRPIPQELFQDTEAVQAAFYRSAIPEDPTSTTWEQVQEALDSIRSQPPLFSPDGGPMRTGSGEHTTGPSLDVTDPRVFIDLVNQMGKEDPREDPDHDLETPAPRLLLCSCRRWGAYVQDQDDVVVLMHKYRDHLRQVWGC